MKTTMQARVRASAAAHLADMDGESVLLNAETGIYYGLNRVGTAMWYCLTERGLVQDAYDALLARYAVSEEQLERDLLALIDDLVAHRLLEVEID